jgi:hypothetical protein
MKRLFLSLTLCIPGLVGSLTLSGCSGFNNLEMSGPVQQQVKMGGLSGSNFGGHAPVTQADIYLFQVGTGGYASTPTSLLTSTYDTQFGFVTTNTNATGDGAPAGAYSVQTDNSGAFYISNYTCTSGYPVYLAAVGGTTTSFTPFAIQSFTVAGATGGGLFGNNPPFTGGTITFNIAAGENAILYNGQQVTLSAAINGVTSPVTVTASTVPTATAAGSFTITNTSTSNDNGTHTYTGTGTPLGMENHATTNLATLGLCPSSGNFYTAGNGQINFVYMNEVSTMATALAFGGFGNGPFAIGVPNNGTAGVAEPNALVGIQNAALNANQLYDITGTSQSTVNEGEGHIARQFTPGGNGIVPRALLDTLGNILASCVDSVNTTVGTTTAALAAESTSCRTLFESATSNGTLATSGATIPTDIATAAFNIAHHPSGPAGGSSTSTANQATSSLFFMNQLYPLQGTTSPFAPNLTAQPKDFTAAIEYTATVNGVSNPVQRAESIGIDVDGSVWINSAGSDQIIKFSPQGVLQYTSPAATYSYGYLSIDPAGDVWTGNNFTNAGQTEFIGSGTSYTGHVYTGPTAAPFNGTSTYDAYITVTDASGNAYAASTPQTGGTGNNSQWYTVAYGPGGASPTASNLAPSIPANYVVGHGAIDNAGFVWWTTELPNGTTNNTTGTAIGRFNLATGAIAPNFPIHTNGTNYTGTVGTTNAAILAPEMPSIDSAGNLWVANQNGGNNGSVMKVSATGGITTATGGVVDGPFGVSVDGAGHVWVANRSTGTANNATVLEFSAAGAAISPSENFGLGFGAAGSSTMPAPLNLAVDQSGVVWITSYDGSAVMELLGPGTPTFNPISTAIGKTVGTSKLGSTP